METLAPAIVELIMVCGAMALLMVGVFTGKKAFKTVSMLSVVVLVLALIAQTQQFACKYHQLAIDIHLTFP